MLSYSHWKVSSCRIIGVIAFVSVSVVYFKYTGCWDWGICEIAMFIFASVNIIAIVLVSQCCHRKQKRPFFQWCWQREQNRSLCYVFLSALRRYNIQFFFQFVDLIEYDSENVSEAIRYNKHKLKRAHYENENRKTFKTVFSLTTFCMYYIAGCCSLLW